MLWRTRPVMSRGARGEAIFDDDADRDLYLKTLGETCGRTGWLVHAYVLMGNHYHMLLETPEANLVAGMKWLLSTYTLRYNVRHRRHGHVFQGRYKAVMIDAEESGFTARVSTYIHLNPLRAGLEKKAGEYLWSSLSVYLGRAKAPAWLEMERVYGSVEIDSRKRLEGREYGRYLNRVIRANARCKVRGDGWELLRRGWCIGDDAFRARLLKAIGKKVAGARAETYGGGAKRAHDERYADKLIQAGLSALGLKRTELAGLRKGEKRKQVMAWWLSRQTSAEGEWISRQLHMGHRTAVSKAAKAVEEGMDPDLNILRKVVEKTPRITDPYSLFPRTRRPFLRCCWGRNRTHFAFKSRARSPWPASRRCSLPGNGCPFSAPRCGRPCCRPRHPRPAGNLYHGPCRLCTTCRAMRI